MNRHLSSPILLLLLLLFLLFFSSSTTSARSLAPVYGQTAAKHSVTTHGHETSLANTELTSLANTELSDVTGFRLEECDLKDEDCEKTRMTAEAHLDYIYTQHHNP